MRFTRWMTTFALAAGLCGGAQAQAQRDSPVTPQPPFAVIDPAQADGPIRIVGSAQAGWPLHILAEAFVEAGFSGEITQEFAGSSAGLRDLCAGEADLAPTTRPMQPDEAAACRQNDERLIAFPLGWQTAVVALNAQDAVRGDLSLEQVAQLFGGVERWSQIDPAWPDARIRLYLPGADSLTYALLVNVALGGDDAPLQMANVLLGDDDSYLMLQALARGRHEAALVPFDVFEQADPSDVIAARIDGIAPTRTTITDGSYPLARPLLVYTTASALGHPQVAALLNFVLRADLSSLPTQGVDLLIPTSEQVAAAQAVWEAEIGG